MREKVLELIAKIKDYCIHQPNCHVCNLYDICDYYFDNGPPYSWFPDKDLKKE